MSFKFCSSGNHWEFTYNDALLSAEATLRTGTTFGQGSVLDKRTVKTDVRGNVVERESFADASQSFLFEYEYDGANRLIASTGPGGDALEHGGTGETVSERQTLARSYVYDSGDNTFTLTEIMGDVESTVVRDALGRPVTVSVETVGASAPTHVVNYDYDPMHHWVEITQGTEQARDLAVTAYTDLAGNQVLRRYKDGTFEINRFDTAGNRIAAIDEIGLETTFTYDARNRLETTVMPDASQVTLGYDGENNLVSRLMPGNLLWTAAYDNANRIDHEYLTGSDGTSVSRYIDYAYYSAGSVNGLLQHRHEKANQSASPLATHTYLYDSRLRLSRVESRDGDFGDGRHYPAVDTAFDYDFRSLLGEITRGSPAFESDPVVSTRVTREFDGYGQLIDEKVEAGTGSVDAFIPESEPISHFVQHWDGNGRRDALRIGSGATVSSALFDFAHDVGRLDSVTAATPSGDVLVDYAYADNGYRTGESISWNSTVLQTATVDPSTGRDLRGRILNRSVKDSSNSSVLAEAVQYLDDGRVSSYGVVQGAGTGGAWGDFTENRDYHYNPENRRLSSETYYSDPTVGVSSEEQIDYTFDGDNLGVRIKAQIQGGNTPWEVDNPTTTGLDAFYRIAEESSDSGLRGVMIQGTTTGPAEYSLLVDGELTGSFRPDPEYGSGNWSYPLQLTTGESHTIEARAKHLHPDSSHEVSSTSTFTVNSQTDEIYTEYDSSGRTLSRSWAWDSGAYQVVQTFQWDASGQLREITQTDSRAQPELPNLDWTAVYDGLGRRVRTTTDYFDNSLIGPVTVNSSYDPQVEFLEVAISVDGKKTWKVYGADLDAGYGSFQGVGGLKVLIDNDTGEVTPVLHNSFGHVLGYMDSQNTLATGDDEYVWNQLQMSGYGPHSGYQQPLVETGADYRDALGWQGRRLDSTGFYGMGARMYDSRSGRFISPDPLGHRASMDLYSYASGDPINFFDPTGRNAYFIYDKASGEVQRIGEYDGSWNSFFGIMSEFPGAVYSGVFKGIPRQVSLAGKEIKSEAYSEITSSPDPISGYLSGIKYYAGSAFQFGGMASGTLLGFPENAIDLSNHSLSSVGFYGQEAQELAVNTTLLTAAEASFVAQEGPGFAWDNKGKIVNSFISGDPFDYSVGLIHQSDNTLALAFFSSESEAVSSIVDAAGFAAGHFAYRQFGGSIHGGNPGSLSSALALAGPFALTNGWLEANRDLLSGLGNNGFELNISYKKGFGFDLNYRNIAEISVDPVAGNNPKPRP